MLKYSLGLICVAFNSCFLPSVCGCVVVGLCTTINQGLCSKGRLGMSIAIRTVRVVKGTVVVVFTRSGRHYAFFENQRYSSCHALR